VYVTLGGIVVFVVFFLIVFVVGRHRLRRLARSRSGEGFAEFNASFSGSDIPEYIQRNVFEYCQEAYASTVREFPVRAHDSLLNYFDDDGELQEAIYKLAEKCGKERPLLNVWQGKPIANIGDLVRFLAWLPTPEEVRDGGGRRLWIDQ
jgi:hypothetical protein